MALQLNMALDNGFSADYWKIDKIEIVYDKQARTIISLGLYKSNAARNAGKSAIQTSILLFDGSIETRKECYTIIKQPIIVKIIDIPYNEMEGIVIQEVSHTIDTNPFSEAIDV